MDTERLAPRRYNAPPLARRDTHITVIDDEAQEGIEYFSLELLHNNSKYVLSPTEDNFPTPKAHDFPKPGTSAPSATERQKPADFDDMYDATDDESEEVPLICSNSVKKMSRGSKGRYPSIIIPSPSAWPTVQKLQETATSGVPPMPPGKIPVSPAILSLLSARSLQVPTRSSTPSLDSDLSSADDLTDSSCPSTPDVQNRLGDEQEWSIHRQLPPKALRTLQQLSSDLDHDHHKLGLDVPEAEMMQIPVDHRQQSIDVVVTPVDQDCPSEPISALTIPSPGGFFSSLRASARHTWCSPTATQAPTTSTAEQFYGIPWRRSLSTISEVNTEDLDRQSMLSRRMSVVNRGSHSSDYSEVIKTTEIVYEYDEDYCNKLQEVGSANLDQTGHWLSAQASFIEEALREDGSSRPEVTTSYPGNRTQTNSPDASASPPSKKAVKFVDQTLPKPRAVGQSEEEQLDIQNRSIFYHGFQHMATSNCPLDAITHGEARWEATRLQRLYLTQAHHDQLRGNFELKEFQRPCPSRPVSQLLPTPDESTALKELVHRAEREGQALDQIQSSTWALQAMKSLNHGQLLLSPAEELLKRSEPSVVRVLDLGGEPTCDWAWQLALSHRNIKVCTATTTVQNSTSLIRGPSNHRVVTVPHLWALPFPNASFDVISARTLYQFLKTQKPCSPIAPNFGTNRHSIDDYDLCLKECMRCLKPGGYVEFWLMDSDIIGAGTRGAALGVEFGFSLRTRGYDGQPTRGFIERLYKAGFVNVKRAWNILPLGSIGMTDRAPSHKLGAADAEIGIADGGEVKGSTEHAAKAAGLLGSWMWEKWILKLQTEMGKDERQLLEGVSAALEEGRKAGGGWRCLSGWARKPAV